MTKLSPPTKQMTQTQGGGGHIQGETDTGGDGHRDGLNNCTQRVEHTQGGGDIHREDVHTWESIHRGEGRTQVECT